VEPHGALDVRRDGRSREHAGQPALLVDARVAGARGTVRQPYAERRSGQLANAWVRVVVEGQSRHRGVPTRRCDREPERRAPRPGMRRGEKAVEIVAGETPPKATELTRRLAHHAGRVGVEKRREERKRHLAPSEVRDAAHRRSSQRGRMLAADQRREQLRVALRARLAETSYRRPRWQVLPVEGRRVPTDGRGPSLGRAPEKRSAVEQERRKPIAQERLGRSRDGERTNAGRAHVEQRVHGFAIGVESALRCRSAAPRARIPRRHFDQLVHGQRNALDREQARRRIGGAREAVLCLRRQAREVVVKGALGRSPPAR
jgi:hypothetical protein